MTTIGKKARWAAHFFTAAGRNVKLHRFSEREMLDQIVEIIYGEIGFCPTCHVATRDLDFTGQSSDGSLDFAAFCPHCRQIWRTKLWPLPVK